MTIERPNPRSAWPSWNAKDKVENQEGSMKLSRFLAAALLVLPVVALAAQRVQVWEEFTTVSG